MLPGQPWRFHFFLFLSQKTTGSSGAVCLCSSANIPYSPKLGTSREQKKLNSWLPCIYVDNERSPWIHSFWNTYTTYFLRNGHCSFCLGNSAVNTSSCGQASRLLAAFLWDFQGWRESCVTAMHILCISPCLGRGPCGKKVLRKWGGTAEITIYTHCM